LHFTDYIFSCINGVAGKSTLLDGIMIFGSRVLPFILMALVAFIFIIGVINKDKKCRSAAANTIVMTAINLVLSFIIGHIWYFPRPFVNDKNINLLYPHTPDASFPSDHALGSMSIALGLNRYSKLIGRITIGLSIFIGISRIYVGHHYPLDVLGSFGIAVLTSYLYKKFIGNKVTDIYFNVEKHIPILKRLVS